MTRTRSADQLGNFGYPLGMKYEPTETAVVVARHMRALSKTQSFRRKTKLTRWSVDTQTGEVVYTRRSAWRRVVYMANQSRGFITVNDGPKAARDVARLLGAVVAPPVPRETAPVDWAGLSAWIVSTGV